MKTATPKCHYGCGADVLKKNVACSECIKNYINEGREILDKKYEKLSPAKKLRYAVDPKGLKKVLEA